jgi:hypothetical protein
MAKGVETVPLSDGFTVIEPSLSPVPGREIEGRQFSVIHIRE